MNDITRKRIMRKLENLPDEVLYEIVDFIDFVEKRHGTNAVSASPLQRIAEGVEDVMRAGRLPVNAIKGTMNVMGTAGKMVDGITSAGQSVFEEIQKAATSETPAVDGGDDETQVESTTDEEPAGEEKSPDDSTT